jgi:hypothetical protein
MAAVTITLKLDAVNRMLSTIAEAPVTSLSGSLPVDATRAIAVLDEIDLEMQSEGWHFNTERVLLTQSGGKVAVPAGTVRVYVNPAEYSNFDITTRDDSGTLRLYDKAHNTFTLSMDVYATTVLLYDFEKTPEPYKRACTIRACRVFADRRLGDQAKHAYTRQDELKAYADLRRHEGFVDTRTIFDGYDAARPILRGKPIIGQSSPSLQY